MNLDELRTVRDKERQTDRLQHLRDSFYEDVDEYVGELRVEHAERIERGERFTDPEMSRLTDEIETAETLVEGIWERRMGKLVKQASLAAAGMAADNEGLTTEEKELFAALVDEIERNRETVLESLGAPAAVGDAEPARPAVEREPTDTADELMDAADEPTDGATAVSDGAADAVDPVEPTTDGGPAAEESPPIPPEEPPDHPGAETDSPQPGPGDNLEPEAGGDPESDTSDTAGGDDTAETDENAPDRTTVLITDDVGEILGIDERAYELAAEDVAKLPTANAEPLIERGVAERLD